MGSTLGSIGGMFTTRRTKGAADRAISGGQLGGDISMLENLLLPYDELVRMGRIAPGTDLGFTGNQSRLGRNIGAFNESVASGDPVFAGYQTQMLNNLNFDENGLPADLSRSITQGVRSSLASRGLEDSSIGALQEVAALAGGSEAIRNNRLSQVRDFLSSSTGNAIQALFPGISTIYQGELQRAINRASNTVGAAQIGAGLAS